MSRGDGDYNISASQVKAHDKCALQWWFRYRSDKEGTKGDSKYLHLGSRVHESIEDALTAESPPPMDNSEALKAAFQNIFREKDEYPIPDEFYENGMEYCEKAAEYIVKRDIEIREVELRHEFEINRSDMSTGVTAIMDIVAGNEIWDWKTGSIRDDTPSDEKIQGSIYMAGYYDKFGEEPDAIRFVYVKEGKVRTLEPDDDIWEYMAVRAKALVQSKESGEFPANPGSMCYWCDHEFYCPESPVGMGNVPYEEY